MEPKAYRFDEMKDSEHFRFPSLACKPGEFMKVWQGEAEQVFRDEKGFVSKLKVGVKVADDEMVIPLDFWGK
jgi:hypothetical protein